MNTLSAAVRSAAVMAFGCAVASAQPPATLFDRLPPGTHGVGFRLVPMGDAEGRVVHLWYPARTRDRTCLTFGDYLAFESNSASALADARGRYSSVFGEIDSTRWNWIVSARLRGCREADPAPGKHPVVVSMYAPGNWTFHAEYFASHGYVVALVTNAPGGRPPPGDMTAFVATQLDRQASSLEALVRRLGSEAFADTARIGVLGQAPSTFLFAMRNAALVDAVSLQDADIFTPGLSANALRMASGWHLDALRAPFLHVVYTDALPGESLRHELSELRASDRYRLLLTVAHSGHEDLTGAGYLIRRVVDSRSGDPLTRTFEAMVRTQHAFFDAHVRGDSLRRQTLDRDHGNLVAPAVGRLERIPAEKR